MKSKKSDPRLQGRPPAPPSQQPPQSPPEVVGVGALGDALDQRPEEPMLPPQYVTPVSSFVHLLVLPARQTKAGLILPETAAADSFETPEALVVAAGPECKRLKRGDKVLCFAATQAGLITHRGYKLVMILEERVAGVVTEPAEVKEARLRQSFLALGQQETGRLTEGKATLSELAEARDTYEATTPRNDKLLWTGDAGTEPNP